MDWVRIDRGDKTCDRYFDNIYALARGLVREMKAAGHVVCDSSGGYRFANPKDGRFQSLKKQLERDWLPQAQQLTLIEHLENLFVKERGAFRREEIEQINLALVDTAHRANGSDAAVMKQNKDGRARQARRQGSEGSGKLLRRASTATGSPTRIYDASDLVERGLYTDAQGWLDKLFQRLRDPSSGPSLYEQLSERYDAAQTRGQNPGDAVQANGSVTVGKAEFGHGGKRKPGRPPKKRGEIEAQTKQDIDAKCITVETLSNMKQEALAKRYGVSRETAVNALEIVLSEIAGN